MPNDCKNFDRVPQIADKVQHMDRELGEVSAKATSAHKRLDDGSSKMDNILTLVEDTSDEILGHMKTEEGMYKVLGWILTAIAGLLVSFMSWSYIMHVDKMVLLAKQQVIIENNQKMITKLVDDSKTHEHERGKR